MIRQLILRYMRRSEPTPCQPDPTWAASHAAEEWDVTDEAVLAQVFESEYPQLRNIAERHMRRERLDHTLQPTALVNEVFLKMARQKRFTLRGRAHFLAFASRIMRRLLIDLARARHAERRGGAPIFVQLDPKDCPVPDGAIDALELDEVLGRLSEDDARAAKVVELKFFGGLTFEEIGQVLSIDERTAKRDWEFAKARLYGYLHPDSEKRDAS
jgi:RNA polymerase sigma-70 factor, ECF subfamily